MELNDAAPAGNAGHVCRRSMSSTAHVLATRIVTVPEEAAVMEVYNGRNTVCMRDTDR